MERTHTPILMYHTLDERHSIIAISAEVFAWQMHWLHENNYQVIPLGQLVQYLHRGEPLPVRSVVITFDDGFESVYTQAFPILAQYGFSATVFLVTGYCGQQNDWPHQAMGVPRYPLLTWTQIREMDRYGFEFGAHTITHPRLDQLEVAKIEYEVMNSKTSIEEQVGHPIELFAYPYGRYNEAAKAIVDGVYAGACTTQLGTICRKSDPLALERIEVLYLVYPLLFRGLSRSYFPLYLNFRRFLRATASVVLRRAWS